MSTRRPPSLQGRLLALLLAAVVAVWTVTALSTWADVQHELDELLDGHLAQAAALLVVQQAGAPHDDDTRQDAPQLHRYAPRVAFQLWHAGQLVARSANAPATPMVDPPPGPAAARADARAHRHDDRDDDEDHPAPRREGARAAGVGLGFHDVQLAGADWRVFVARGVDRDLLVFVGEQAASRNDILWAVVRGMLWPMALALPLLAAVVWWAVRRGTAPLRGLGRLLATRDPQALAPVQLPDAPAEMQPMLAALNRLFERITAMVASERRFTADAAHELRTPIAAIRTQAQVALAEPDDDARRHALRATLAGCDRATRLVEQLLTLARLEAGSDGAAPQAMSTGLVAVDLAALAQRVAAELAPAALARGQQLALEATRVPPVQAHEALAAVLLRNLLDNALRYSPQAATVRIGVAPAEGAAGGVQITVEDSGPGLAEAERTRLGERFFRVLGSGADGSGLGWSIVRRVAEVHGARLQVGRSEALGGLQVQLVWPASPPTMRA